MNEQTGRTKKTSDFGARCKRNTANLALWTIAWTLSMALATFGPKFIWEPTSALTIAAIILNLLLGFVMILANIKHLKGMDELQQRIQLDAMAFALGVAVVCGLSYSLLDTTNVISADAEISHLVILIGLTYFFGTVVGTRRYR